MIHYNRKIPEIIFRICEKVLVDPLSTWWIRFQLWTWKATVGRDLKVSGRLRLRLQGKLTIGNQVRILSGYANYVGGSESMAIWVCPEGEITIGNGCRLSNTTLVCKNRIDILEETLVGGGCRIFDTDFHQIEPDARVLNSGDIPSVPIIIGPRAFIGGHSIILKGVSIGESSIIGAGSVVTKSVPAGEIWAGVPARFIRKLY